MDKKSKQEPDAENHPTEKLNKKTKKVRWRKMSEGPSSVPQGFSVADIPTGTPPVSAWSKKKGSELFRKVDDEMNKEELMMKLVLEESMRSLEEDNKRRLKMTNLDRATVQSTETGCLLNDSYYLPQFANTKKDSCGFQDHYGICSFTSDSPMPTPYGSHRPQTLSQTWTQVPLNQPNNLQSLDPLMKTIKPTKEQLYMKYCSLLQILKQIEEQLQEAQVEPPMPVAQPQPQPTLGVISPPAAMPMSVNQFFPMGISSYQVPTHLIQPGPNAGIISPTMQYNSLGSMNNSPEIKPVEDSMQTSVGRGSR